MESTSEHVRPLSAREVLRIRDYRILWLSQLVSETGDAFTRGREGEMLHTLPGRALSTKDSD